MYFQGMDLWKPGRGRVPDAAIKQWQDMAWLSARDDAHLQWVTTICDTFAETEPGQPKQKAPPEQWVLNVENARRILAWRRLGADGPFR